MKLELQTKEFQAAIKLCAAAIGLGEDHIVSFIPTDQRMKVVSGIQSVVVTGVNVTIEGKAEPFATSLSHLESFLSSFNSPSFKIDVTKTKAVITSGKLSGSFSLTEPNVTQSTAFPVESIVAVVNRKELLKAIESVILMTDTHVDWKDFVQIECVDNFIHITATNKFRWGVVTLANSMTRTETEVFMLDGPLVNKILDNYPTIDNIIIAKASNRIAIGTPSDFVLLPIRYRNEFPLMAKVEQAFNIDNHVSVLVNRKELEEAVRAAISVIKRKTTIDAAIELDISMYAVSVSTCLCPGAYEGQVLGSDRIVQEIDFELDTERGGVRLSSIVTIHLKSEQLLSVIRSLNTEIIRIAFKGNRQPVIFFPDYPDGEQEIWNFYSLAPLGDLSKYTPPLKA